MPYRASPLRNVPDMARASVAASEVEGTDFDGTNAVSISTSTVTHANGQAAGVYAVLPDKHNYDYLRFSFKSTITGTAAGVVLGLWQRESDGGMRRVGSSTYVAGEFPVIEIPNTDGRYFLAVDDIASATGVDVDISVQGLYSIPTVFAGA